MAALPYQELLLFTPLHPEAEHPYGVSLLRGLPFMADILMKIYNTVGVNWERCGNMRFAVTCRDGDGNAAERGQLLASEWSRAMQDTRSGSVRDFVAVGDVDIKVIGGDAPILDSQVPVRQVLEQIVAKTSIPPFMLGLNWNSTERMSAQQADMLTTEITAIRRTLTPVMEQICRMWLRMQGETAAFRVDWEDINLQDEVEEAKAELYREQARKLRIENDVAEGKIEDRAAGAAKKACQEETDADKGRTGSDQPVQQGGADGGSGVYIQRAAVRQRGGPGLGAVRYGGAQHTGRPVRGEERHL